MTCRIVLGVVSLVAAVLANPTEASDLSYGEPVGTTMEIGDLEGNPIFQLPSNMRLLSSFGERPVFSPDGMRIAFIGESYGDAYELDLASGAVRNLTAHAPHHGFLRIHYLADGSFLLLGPRIPASTREATRNSTIELFWMDANASGAPVALRRTVWEGIAVSRASNTVAWAEIHPLAPSIAGVQTTSIMKGTVATGNGQARLENVRKAYETEVSRCYIEPQDFLPGDDALLMPCYHIPLKEGARQTDVVQLDLATGDITTHPTPANLYGEVEGLFPDGERTLVECSGDRSAGMDICVLSLNLTNPTYTRLTRIMDYGRWKYGNPVVSPDGRWIAAQIGSADVVDPGVGQGIVLMDLGEGR